MVSFPPDTSHLLQLIDLMFYWSLEMEFNSKYDLYLKHVWEW